MDYKTLLGETWTQEAEDGLKKAIGAEFVPRTEFNAANEARKKAEAQIDALKGEGSPEELKKQISAAQEQQKTLKTEYEKQIADLRVAHAVETALADAHDPALVAVLVDRGKIKLDEKGSISEGLEDQLKALRESKAFLFKQKEEVGFRGVTPANPPPPANATKNPFSKEFFNLTEQGRLMRDDPERARQLQAAAN